MVFDLMSKNTGYCIKLRQFYNRLNPKYRRSLKSILHEVLTKRLGSFDNGVNVPHPSLVQTICGHYHSHPGIANRSNDPYYSDECYLALIMTDYWGAMQWIDRPLLVLYSSSSWSMLDAQYKKKDPPLFCICVISDAECHPDPRSAELDLNTDANKIAHQDYKSLVLSGCDSVGMLFSAISIPLWPIYYFGVVCGTRTFIQEMGNETTPTWMSFSL